MWLLYGVIWRVGSAAVQGWVQMGAAAEDQRSVRSGSFWQALRTA